MAGGRRGRRPSRAEPCHRLDVRRSLRRALALSGAGAAGPDADRSRARHIGRAGGRRGGARSVDGSRGAYCGRAACRRRDVSPIGPRRAGVLVLHDVHGAWRWIDAGAGADPALQGDAPAREITASGSLALALAAVGVHTAAMLAVTGVMAAGVCRGFDAVASLLRRLGRKPLC